MAGEQDITIGGLNIGQGFNIGKVGEAGSGANKTYMVELKDIGILKFKEQTTNSSSSKQPRVTTISHGDSVNKNNQQLATIALFDLNDCELEVTNDLNKTRYSEGISIFGETTKNLTVDTSSNNSKDLIRTLGVKDKEVKIIKDNLDDIKKLR